MRDYLLCYTILTVMSLVRSALHRYFITVSQQYIIITICKLRGISTEIPDLGPALIFKYGTSKQFIFVIDVTNCHRNWFIPANILAYKQLWFS